MSDGRLTIDLIAKAIISSMVEEITSIIKNFTIKKKIQDKIEQMNNHTYLYRIFYHLDPTDQP